MTPSKLIGDRFIQALEALETQKALEPLAGLFCEDCEISNLMAHTPYQGRVGARRFWTEYLHAFESVRSRFIHRTDHEDLVTLEWISEGKLRNGERFEYQGVTLLGIEGGRVKRFRAYYDSAALPWGRSAAA